MVKIGKLETIKIDPNINNYDILFDLWKYIDDLSCPEVEFNFSNCDFLAHHTVAFLGGLANLISNKTGGRFEFDWDTLQEKIRKNLAQNGFITAFSGAGQPWAGNSIPYREDPKSDHDDIIDYLKSKWLGRGWVHVSKRLRDAIVGRVWEIYANAFEHSSSGNISIYSCGQHYPHKHQLSLCVVDFGIGILTNVRNFQGQELSAAEAMQWAFKRGTTTAKPTGPGRGVGLDLLKEFVKLNNGRLEIFSNDGFAKISKNGDYFSRSNKFFGGTLVDITLICDEKLYSFSDEDISRSIF